MPRKFRELTYASENDPKLKQWIIKAIERLSGREKFLPLYRYWRTHVVPKSQRPWGEALNLVGVTVKLNTGGRAWPPKIPEHAPLIIIANHPFGIGDGIAVMALAEQLGRPFKVLVNNQLMRIPEIRPYSLPIDFEETRAAQEINLKTRKEALKLLAEGTTLIVFPAGGVATAESPFGRAVDLPWKLFTARMIQSSKATIMPIWFEGQNGPMFQLVSKFSLTLRLSLLVSEFRKFAGLRLAVSVGPLIPFEALPNSGDRKLLTEELHRIVHGLANPNWRPRRFRKFRGISRLARQKAKRVGRFASRKALGVGRLARRKLRRRPRTPAPRR
jgi:putative hemolysin